MNIWYGCQGVKDKKDPIVGGCTRMISRTRWFKEGESSRGTQLETKMIKNTKEGVMRKGGLSSGREGYQVVKGRE